MYISRKLLPNEKNYSTVEKEALAIKWALDKLRYYLLGREFTLVTDHAPLKWMATAKDSNARVTRWFLALQDFRFQVDHRPGRDHAKCLASVATRPKTLRPIGLRERWWRAYTADIEQPEPKSIHCVTPISEMEYTCDGG